MAVTESEMKDMLMEALQPGPMTRPLALLAALEAETTPLDAIAQAEGASPLTTAIEQDFAFLRYWRLETAGGEAHWRWVTLVRWLIAGLRDWRRADDDRMKVLAALLVTSRLCCGEAGLWHALPEDNAPSAEFVATLGGFVAKRRIVYRSRGSAAPPIWESEFIEKFQRADAEGDWMEIANAWPRLGFDGRSDFLFTEMVRCLAHYGFGELVQAADALSQCPPVMEMARALSVDQRLRLAIASGSGRVRFCCAYSTVERGAETIALSADQEAVLSELLVKVAASPEEWRQWMAAFNTYPLRYPIFHRPLGHALARVSHEATAIYVDSIQLHPLRIMDGDESRFLITASLRAFAQHASPQRRHEVWAYAFQRWRAWRFGAAVPETNLSDINRCALDFAVVAYACECMSAMDRESALADLRDKLSQVEFAWHEAKIDCTTEWNRLLSLFQPYAHASVVAKSGEDALPGPSLYYPFDLSQSSYHRIMFRVPEHPTRLASD